MKLICPNKSFFSNWMKQEIQKKFTCKIKDLDNRIFNKEVHNYEIVLLRAKSFLKYRENSKIKYILSPTTGLNHIDTKILKSNKTQIFSLNNEFKFLKKVNATVEFTIYLILYSVRHNQLSKLTKKNINELGIEINKKKIGIIGNGRIGKKVIGILKSFGAEIIVYEIKKHNKKKLTKLLTECDIISIHIPLQNNYNFIDNKKIKLIRNDCRIINTSRGEIFDEKALIKAIEKRNISYFTDVLSNENLIDKSPLMKLKKNFYYTQHIGGLTKESVELTDKFIFKKFIKFYEKN